MRSFNFNLVLLTNIAFAKQIKRCFKYKCKYTWPLFQHCDQSPPSYFHLSSIIQNDNLVIKVLFVVTYIPEGSGYSQTAKRRGTFVEQPCEFALRTIFAAIKFPRCRARKRCVVLFAAAGGDISLFVTALDTRREIKLITSRKRKFS